MFQLGTWNISGSDEAQPTRVILGGAGPIEQLGQLTALGYPGDTMLGRPISGLPRFAVAGVHRSVTLIATVFVALHVATTVLDGFAPIGWTDAVIPFVSSYRPVWLGLGAVAFDLLLALVITSLLRARIGYRLWRATHWLAYVSWPVALLHSLGTGSDARVGWLQAIALGSVLAVALTLAARLAVGPGAAGRRLAAGAALVAVLLGIGIWYRGGPGAQGWAWKPRT